MAESRQWVSNIKVSILLKGWFYYVRVSLKRDNYQIYMAQLSLQSIKLELNVFYQYQYQVFQI